MNFAEFFAAYNETVKKARDGKLEISDFQGTTISLTNPGTIGTVSSNPRLMSGQSAIIATGAIEYPAEYQAMTAARFVAARHQQSHHFDFDLRSPRYSRRGKRFVSGENSRIFNRAKHDFYDEIFRDLEINYAPLRWAKIIIRRCSAATTFASKPKTGESFGINQRLPHARASARRH
jgi:2-oxoglutarate decarboxylase